MSITPESVQGLLNSENYGDRLTGINQLRQLEPVVALEMAKPLINDSQARVRYAIVSQMDTLGVEKPQEVFPLLRDRLLNDSEMDVRAAAADALAALKITEAFEDLKEVYESTSEWLLQFSIIAALGAMGDPRGFGLLEKALSSENNLVQMAAISSLGELGDQKALSLIVPFQDNEDWQIRYRVAQAIGNMVAVEGKGVLEKLVEDPINQVSEEAKRALEKLS